jgi:pimeloyl-ACP methyl ester carboxylesterase
VPAPVPVPVPGPKPPIAQAIGGFSNSSYPPFAMRRLPVLLLLAACHPTPPPIAPTPPAPAEAPPPTPAPPRAPAYFTGAVDLPSGPLPFHVAVTPSTTAWSATIDIPLQGTRGLPLQSVTYDGATLSFALDVVAATWRITLDDAGASTTCEVTQTGSTFACTLRTIDATAFAELTSPPRPQTPKPPFPYATRDLEIDAGAVTLAGTLAIPAGPGPHRAAVLITGSGAQDRDETIFGHKPFAVLADHLARRGIATLRLDDRGVGGSTGDLTKATTADLAADVRAAHAWLRTQPEIAADQVGVIGHSEGAIVGPAAAAKDPTIAFVVLLAAPGVPGEAIVVEQTELITRRSGLPEPEVIKAVSRQRQIFDTLRTVKDETTARARVAEILRSAGPIDDAVLAPQIDVLFSPWFRAFMAHDPRPDLTKLRVPVLALAGELDLQVSPDQNLPEIERALRRGKNRRVTVHRLPGLNHLFQPARTGLVAEYGLIEQTLAPQVLVLVADWIAGLGTPAARP